MLAPISVSWNIDLPPAQPPSDIHQPGSHWHCLVTNIGPPKHYSHDNNHTNRPEIVLNPLLRTMERKIWGPNELNLSPESAIVLEMDECKYGMQPMHPQPQIGEYLPHYCINHIVTIGQKSRLRALNPVFHIFTLIMQWTLEEPPYTCYQKNRGFWIRISNWHHGMHDASLLKL